MFNHGKSEGTDYQAEHILLHGCHFVAFVLIKGNDTNSMVRGVIVVWWKNNGYEVDIKGCGRCSVVKK